jgi:hypothetical protein
VALQPSLPKLSLFNSFQMDAQTGVNGTNGANGADGAQHHFEDGLPSKNEKDLIGMPSGELIPDPDANLTEAERIAAV